MVRQWQKLFFNKRFAGSDKSLHQKDFIKAAEADGFQWAQRLDDKSKIDDVVKDFLAFEGPAFLEVIIALPLTRRLFSKGFLSLLLNSGKGRRSRMIA